MNLIFLNFYFNFQGRTCMHTTIQIRDVANNWIVEQKIFSEKNNCKFEN
jgi:hypothetical protein